MKIISLNSEDQKEVFLRCHTNKNKIRILKFTSERIATFPRFIDFIWHFPNGDKKESRQSPDVFGTPYHRQPIYDVWRNPFILEDVQYLKFLLSDEEGLTDKGEKSNCKIYFEEL